MTQSKEGTSIPNVTFRTREGDEWIDINSTSLFSGKNVVVFSLPGAFTPTCSATHLPRYNQLAGLFKQHGVDEIVCVSVNDGFVMNAWKKDQEAENITVIPDGNGEFSEQMGMLVDKNDLGFGKRSWRYSMYVADGTALANARGATRCMWPTAPLKKCSLSPISPATPLKSPTPTLCSATWRPR